MNAPQTPVRLVVWHTEGTAISGLLSWMWRLKRSLPTAGIHVTLVSLELQPFRFPQVCEVEKLYDVRVKTAQEFLAILKRNVTAIHLINHAFEYVDLLAQLNPQLLNRLKLVGICHTDQDCYYEELTRLSSHLSGVMAVSEQCAETLADKLAKHRGNIPVFPSWDMPVPNSLTKAVNRTGHLRVIFNGRLVQTQKRVFDLPLITRRLAEKGIQLSLSLVGDGPDRADLMRRFSPGTSVSVKYLGQRAPWEMQELLAEHDVFLQVSQFEGASVSLMEALVAGLVPVVTATASGVELLKHRENALLARVGDVGRIAEHLAELHADRELMNRLSVAAFETGRSAIKRLDYAVRLRNWITDLSPID